MNEDQRSGSEENELQDLEKLNPDHEEEQVLKQGGEGVEKVEGKIPTTEKKPEGSAIKEAPLIKKQLNLVKESKPRLIIDHMVLKNFKSYAGELKIGPFHKNFSSIVGPNGSGKSNLIESMLFIFGFNASKMRLNKLSQLIHNSSGMTNVSSAAVEIHFKKVLDRPDGTVELIAGSEFFIRRTVNSQSVSKYYLNGGDSTQAEIKTKLKSEGIDLVNNRFLILQGEVEQISQMKQKSGDKDKPGFLQYLEDIIGSNQFLEQIEQSIEEYNQIEESKHEKGNRMKAVEQQLKNINAQKDEAIRYVKKERKLFQIESIINQVTRSNSTYELKKVKQQLGSLEQKRDQILKEEREKMAKQADRVKEIKEIQKHIEGFEREKEKLSEAISKLSSEDAQIKAEISFNSEDQVKHNKKIDELCEEFTHIVEESTQIKESLPAKKEKLAADKRDLDEIKGELTKHDKPELREKIKNIESQAKNLNFKANSYADKQKSLGAELQKAGESQENFEEKVSQQKAALKKELENKAKVEIAFEEADKSLSQMTRALDQERGQKDRVRNQISSLEYSMKERNSEQQEQGQFNNMFKHIMKAGIQGVIGRLGDLGEIPKQYDGIITTASGKLDDIVCKNYEAAQNVVNFLKRNNLGRVSCTILDMIQNFKENMLKPYQCPSGTVRLFDLIKTDSEEARLAFYRAYGNTLFCENSEKALQIAMGDDRNRRRVISRKRNGFIIAEMNGLMISTQERRGGFQRKAGPAKLNPEEDQKNKAKLKELSDLFEEKSKICDQITLRIKKLGESIQMMKSEKVMIESKIREIHDEIKDSEKQMTKSKCKEQSIVNLNRQIKAIDNELEKISQEQQKLDQQLEKVEEEQKKHENQQVTSLRAQYKEKRAAYGQFQKEVEKEEAVISTVAKRIKENQKKREQLQNTIKNIESKIERGKKTIGELENKGEQILRRKVGIDEEIAKKKKREEELRSELSTDDDGVKESRRIVQEANQMVETAKHEMRKAEGDCKFAGMELERIRTLYRQMTSTYDFLESLSEIESMKINLSQDETSMLSVSIMNSSANDAGTDRRQSGIDRRKLDLKFLESTDPNKDLSEDQLDPFLLLSDQLRALLSAESADLRKMEGKNIQVISEYRRKFLDYKEKLRQFEEVKEKQIKLKNLIDELKEKRFNMFREGFSLINSKLKEVYQLLTSGGDAELELIDAMDPFSDGVNFSVRPPKKAWKEINKLSGGEKTLSSLSLIFALHYYKPTPLYFMDEIDAALDFKNVSIVADYIKKRTKDAQFIIISLRNNMFDLADKLIGVYKTYDKTKVIGYTPLKKKRKAIEMVEDEKENRSERMNNSASV